MRSQEEENEQMGMYDEDEHRLFKNTDSNGRFHSDWCSMMYSRLMLARNLLKDDGVIFISIDDSEVENLRKIADELFGEINFIADLIWQKKFSRLNDATYFSTMHDHILCYCKKNILVDNQGWKIGLLPRGDEIPSGYGNPDHDPRGAWTSVILSAKSGSSSLLYEITTPSGRKVTPPSGRYWSCSKDTFDKWVADNRIWFGANGDGTPRKKTFLSEVQAGLRPNTILFQDEVGNNQEAKQETKALFDGIGVFDGPKPVRLLKLLEMVANFSSNDIVLDFFSGSATTAHAVMQLNTRTAGTVSLSWCSCRNPVVKRVKPIKLAKLTDSKLSDKKAGTPDDIDAYDLIMKNKELLLDREPKRSPVRFIFSHSALREGWDNPNVFQICTLKQSSSEVRKRQEVGRGLRLCVNQDGERMDANVLGNDVHSVNVLTVIASESYDSFAKGLQTELAEAVANRPVAVTAELFKGKVISDVHGNELVVDGETAQAIYFDMVVNGYVDKKGALTDKYYADKANNAVKAAEEGADCADAVLSIVDSIYDNRAMQPENARDKNVELQVDPEKLAMPEFKALWQRISPKSIYVVDFDTEELVEKAIASLNRNLQVSKIFFKVELGTMNEIQSKEALLEGASFVKERSGVYNAVRHIHASGSVKYDLVGKLVAETGLTRKAVVEILTGIEKSVFDQFKDNPEEFIIKAAELINDEKATAIIQHITYNMLDERYDTDIFTEPTLKGKLGTNAMKAQRHLYDHIVYDSINERDFATDLDTNTDVAVYVKLPDSFYISTPVGRYNPDWAIAFYDGNVKHNYFVAETKGSMRSMQLRLIEESKIHCAREHFKAISNGDVVYDVVDSYAALLTKIMK